MLICKCLVSNRLLELMAEDAALEDTIYHLGRSLNSDTAKLDLEQFLKVRFFPGDSGKPLC